MAIAVPPSPQPVRNNWVVTYLPSAPPSETGSTLSRAPRPPRGRPERPLVPRPVRESGAPSAAQRSRRLNAVRARAAYTASTTTRRRGWGRWRPRFAAFLATACAAFAAFVDYSSQLALKQLQEGDESPELKAQDAAATSPTDPTLHAGVIGYAMLGYEPSIAWFISLVPLGAMCGALPVGLISERIGRKPILFVMGGLCLVSWPLVIVIRKNVDVLYAARFIAGMTMGCSYVLHPMYVSEISYDRGRGTLGMMLPLVTSMQYLLSAVAAVFLPSMWALILPGLFPLILLVAFAKMPESPNYLLSIGYDTESVKAVRWLQGLPKKPEEETADECEMQNLANEDAVVSSCMPSDEQTSTSQVGHLSPSTPFNTCLCQPYSVLVAFLVLILQPLTGAVTMRFYMEASLNSAVLQREIPHGQLVVGIFELAGIVLGCLSIDRVGRQPLLLASSIGSAICYALLGSYFAELSGSSPKVFLTILAALFLVYGFGFGSVPWVILGEVIPSSQKGWASGIVVFFYWSFIFVIVNLFPYSLTFFSQCSIFSAFGAFSIAVIIIVYKVNIETNKKSLDQIQKELQMLHSKNDNPIING